MCKWLIYATKFLFAFYRRLACSYIQFVGKLEAAEKNYSQNYFRNCWRCWANVWPIQ